MCRIIKEIAIGENIAFIHAITPSGGAGKSKFNNERIDIYERFRFNIKERKGIPASIIRDGMHYQSKFGEQGIIIYDGKINNVNQSDAGTMFNDKTGLWETVDGKQFQDKDEVIKEIASSTSYVETNVYDYSICGFFLDFTNKNYLISSIRSLREFYEKTKEYKLPYYGIDNGIIVKIKEKNLSNNDWRRITEGNIVSIKDIYQTGCVI